MKKAIETRSLRTQVYEYLKVMMRDGRLSPGGFLDLNALAAELGISRTPLRDALLVLESDGFVQILSRRGVLIPPLTLERVGDIYEIVGALEGAALITAGDRLDGEAIQRMAVLNSEINETLDPFDVDAFLKKNVEFHRVYLDLSANQELVHLVNTHRARLNDFPPRFSSHTELVGDWARKSALEHARLIELLAAGKRTEAARFLQNVHWSFSKQESFIRRCYTDQQD